MWLIVKLDKKKIDFLKTELKKKIGSEIQYYNPMFKVKIQNKLRSYFREVSLLDDYIFVYCKSFTNLKIVENIRFVKGLKYILSGYINSQKEILEFINKCKKSEDQSGYLTSNFFDLFSDTNYKFKDGPFSNMIFKLIRIDNKKIDILLGDLRTKIDKNKFLISPV